MSLKLSSTVLDCLNSDRKTSHLGNLYIIHQAHDYSSLYGCEASHEQVPS